MGISATAPSVVAGERYVWVGWTGTGTISYTGTDASPSVTMNGPITETAAWTHEYKLTVNVNPHTIDILNVNVDPTGEDLDHNGYWISYWYDSGDSVVLTATKFVSASGVQYIFDLWSGSATGTTNPVTVTMNAPKTVTANYGILPFSAVTSSSLCPLTDNKFKLLFIQDMQNPNTYRLTASNPGQFYYNVFYLGTPEASYSFDITIPAPFVTQGAMPVHIYSDVSFIGGCYVPANEIGVLGTQITGTSGGTIHVEGEVPSTGLVYVAIHLDYGLKGIPPNYKPDASYNAYDTTLTTKLIPNGESYKFSYSGHETSVSNVNDFKKIPGFGGLIQSGGFPVVGVTVTVTIGSTPYSATTNSDGFYLINYKTGKAQSYTLSAGIYGSASGTIKANGFIVNSFIS
jgi:hypothetical protein